MYSTLRTTVGNNFIDEIILKEIQIGFHIYMLYLQIDELVQERRNSIANTLELHGKIYHDTSRNIVITTAGHKSDFQFTKDTPYLALTGEIWGVYCEYFEKNDHVIMASRCIANGTLWCSNGWMCSPGFWPPIGLVSDAQSS